MLGERTRWTASGRARLRWAGLAVGLSVLVGAVALGDRAEPDADPGLPIASAAPRLLPEVGDPTPQPAAAPRPTPSPAAFELWTLPYPDPIELLPPGLPQTSVTDLAQLPRKAAAPDGAAIPVWTAPDDTVPPVLALPDDQYGAAARWVVLDERPDWVQVLMPQGRRALPSQDPSGVNRTAGWVRATDVTVAPEVSAVVVDLSDRMVHVTRPDGTNRSVPAAIGTPATPTPPGLAQVLTITQSQVGLAVYTSAQSETIDSFLGSGGAVVALHAGSGQGREVSNGCVRLTYADFPAVKDLPVGTPILVVP
ncbi:L,D-transpeptidase [Antribacter gilvus]|uniref:L,D-transpeptidase n=1 Tax=Antribacter gilvus TaxID=2304675 RepID=UPI0013DF3C7F|nr:L,D-transpeptidase [Antribacter gilvus]